MGIKITGGLLVGGKLLGGVSAPGEYNSIHEFNTVDFDRDVFARAIADKGYQVTWEKATWCPNRKGPSPTDHDISCTLCDQGHGYVYFDSQETRMLITSAKLSENYYAFGRWDAGTVMVTAMPEQTLEQWDRLTLQNGVTRYSEVVRRTRGAQRDVLKYRALSLLYVAWKDRNEQLHRYVVGTDVQVTADGALEWLAASGTPDAGEPYTVAYTYRPRYIVYDLLHHHRESTIKGEHYQFPTQALAKMDFMIRDEGKDAPQVEDQDPFKPR